MPEPFSSQNLHETHTNSQFAADAFSNTAHLLRSSSQKDSLNEHARWTLAKNKSYEKVAPHSTRNHDKLKQISTIFNSLFNGGAPGDAINRQGILAHFDLSKLNPIVVPEQRKGKPRSG